jgi:hypothetical protein
MFRYALVCQHRDCPHAATYKIAASWSDGLTSELKTYALSCDNHLAELFATSRQRNQRTRTLRGERLETPGIYPIGSGDRDRDLLRLVEVEEQLLRTATPAPKTTSPSP